jgi:hypothetical protein
MRLLRPLALVSLVVASASCSTSSPTMTKSDPKPFAVTVIYLNTPSAAFKAAMDSAVKRLGNIVTGGPSGYQFDMSSADAQTYTTLVRKSTTNGGCGLTNATLPSGAYPGVVIFAQDTATLGSSSVIAQAGPCLVRGGGLPLIASMRFRTDYIASLVSRNQLVDVISHEMTHAIGFNSSTFAARPDSAHPVNSGVGTSTSAFIGAQAKAACMAFPSAVAAQCTLSIPLENTGGSGTADDHWRESVFHIELMTGYIENAGTRMPYSAMTIGALGDIGYTVNLSLAESYTFGATSLRTLESLGLEAPAPTKIQEQILRPVATFIPSNATKP